MKTKHKRGTVGYKIADLVAKFGNFPMGHYIVQAALEKMSQVDGAHVVVQDKRGQAVLVSFTPGYAAAVLEENKCWGRIGMIFYRPDLNIAKRYTPEGKCVAVRFTAGVSEQGMRESMQRDQPTARDWQSYNEADNTFI